VSYRLPPFQLLRTFEAAARHLSFKKAAHEVHVTPAAVSQQIKALEEHLGFPLFRRLTRALALTDRGAALLPKVREGLDCLAAAIASAREAVPCRLTVTAPPSFASHWLVPRLPRFAAAHPDIEVRLASTPDTIGPRGRMRILDEPLVAPGDGRTEVAILYGTGPCPGFQVDRIIAPDYVPVCLPRLLAGDSPLREPQDLRRHVLIHDESLHDGKHRPGWEVWLELAGVAAVDVRRGPRFAHAALAREAALDGQGIALALRPLIEADVAAGRLAIPFDIALPSPYAYELAVSAAVAQRPAVAAFRAWLAGEAQRSLAAGEIRVAA